jgi:hypothetical protein
LKKTTKYLLFVFIVLAACRNANDVLHQDRLNDLIYYKERLEQIKSNLYRIDTNSQRKALENATIKLLNLETVLPKAIDSATALYLLQYKKAYFKINNSNEKRKVIVRDLELVLQQIKFLTLDVQADRLITATEKEMVNRELDAARSILLAEADFKTGLVYAASQLKRMNEGIDSTINYYRKESVE